MAKKKPRPPEPEPKPCEHSYSYWRNIQEKTPHAGSFMWKRVDYFFCCRCLDVRKKVLTEHSQRHPSWWNA